MFAPSLAERGIALKVSGTVPPWVYPHGWEGGGAATLRRVYGLVTGAVKRLAQAVILPYRYDVVVILRDVYAFVGPPWFERLFARRANYLIFELDDAVWLPSPDGKRAIAWTPRKVTTAAQLADRVIAGNEYLAGWARQYCSDVVIVPTASAADVRPCPADRRPGPPRIGWFGQAGGAVFLEPILPSLVAAREQVEYDFHVVSEHFVTDVVQWPTGLPVRLTPWNPDTMAEDLADLDVGIMPVPHDEWARGKCGSKLLNYMAAGLPVVASPVGVNCEIVVQDETGFLASTPEEWTEAIVKLASDPGLRERMGKAGRARLEAVYSPDKVARLYAAAISPPPGTPRRRRVFRRRRHAGSRRWR